MKHLSKIVLILLLMVSVSSATESESDSLFIQKFANQFNLNSANYEIEIAYNSADLNGLTVEQVTYNPITNKDLIGLYTVLVEKTGTTERESLGQIRFRIRKFENVLVTTDRIGRNEIITDQNSKIERVEITTLYQKPFKNLASVDGYRTRKIISKGTTVTSEILEVIPDIEQGMSASIIYDEGLFKVTAEGIAMQDGVIGDFIRVKNKSTRKILTAKVISSNQVIINP